MPLWGNQDFANNTPKTRQIATNNEGLKANGTATWHNTTPSSFTNNMVLGLYGVTTTMVQAAQANHATNLSQPGWTLVRQGMGPLKTINITAGGSGYSNADQFIFSGGSSNVTATPTTNSTGGVTGLSFTTNGMFVNTISVALQTANSTSGAGNSSLGTGFTYTVSLGGRAGRINREVLVALGTMTSNSNTALFPNT